MTKETKLDLSKLTMNHKKDYVFVVPPPNPRKTSGKEPLEIKGVRLRSNPNRLDGELDCRYDGESTGDITQDDLSNKELDKLLLVAKAINEAEFTNTLLQTNADYSRAEPTKAGGTVPINRFGSRIIDYPEFPSDNTPEELEELRAAFRLCNRVYGQQTTKEIIRKLSEGKSVVDVASDITPAMVERFTTARKVSQFTKSDIHQFLTGKRPFLTRERLLKRVMEKGATAFLREIQTAYDSKGDMDMVGYSIKLPVDPKDFHDLNKVTGGALGEFQEGNYEFVYPSQNKNDVGIKEPEHRPFEVSVGVPPKPFPDSIPDRNIIKGGLVTTKGLGGDFDYDALNGDDIPYISPYGDIPTCHLDMLKQLIATVEEIRDNVCKTHLKLVRAKGARYAKLNDLEGHRVLHMRNRGRRIVKQCFKVHKTGKSVPIVVVLDSLSAFEDSSVKENER